MFASSIAAAQSPPATQKFEDRNVLWDAIHQRCAPKAMRKIFPPAPCADVQLGPGGYAVFKDRNGPYQYLLLPLARITGIESPALLAADAANYPAQAWRARLFVEASLHAEQPRDVLGLAINSSQGRSQDQLHIHIDCLRGDVRDAIQRWLPAITQDWRPLPQGLPPSGHRYLAKWVAGENLDENPFKDLASNLSSKEALATRSLAVVGAYNAAHQPGFVLLSGRVDVAAGDHGHAEELQDPTCAIARRPP
ncbi:MAG TPA: CDP-diacylglycerol diphosphatase [Dyella sp.]|uniref:CDP-diacylglycerol diphosphatase n=1 Tax=Dyella sp. TaxID=1869338 RepID=UPI002C0FAE20|nr:CDP-diacylglycerol diphosphatase [Dyella sp.]HTV85439.1 CDP-diacylglycerol diphosphatase [Dyella sp.]